ncbi:MAG: GNAT family N-acetyltransferase [Flavobacteriales bacterium]|jgi:ElaA protein|nr:GNAT family N-acetyltransferase [Flavobacteriales bacterium]MCI1751478.1 GNAT family N-acetyltransferase [Flavobacteriales bacterium]
MTGAQQFQWSVLRFSELDTRLFHDVLRLRVDVFVVEQNCPYPELDGLDLDALHIVGRDANGAVAAYARILPPQADGVPHIGRVVVAMEQRRNHVGKRLMEVTLDALEQQYGSKRSALAAQAHLQKFYAELGYVTTGAEYMLDGIPHVDMVLHR